MLASLGLVASGIVGATAWPIGLWGLLTGATLIAAWLGTLVWWAVVRPHAAPQPSMATEADADAMVLRILLDAAPTALLGIEGKAVRALNRAARTLFATDDRILPIPAALAEPRTTHLTHEGRRWRIDRVTVSNTRAVAALIDIEQEERAAEARATTEMIQVVGHELLNGLAPIASLAESGVTAVDRPVTDLELLREILGTLARRAEGLQRFAEAYRALARLPDPILGPTNLREIADDLVRLSVGRWPNITLSVEVDDGLTWLLDRDQIHQAVWALLQNAAEAAQPRDARVNLRMNDANAQLVIDAMDNGAGIPPASAVRVFRPFHTTKTDGTGIGLARQIALGHGGALNLEQGPYTIFRMTLPRA
jgi:signal transduction histidine kinase